MVLVRPTTEAVAVAAASTLLEEDSKHPTEASIPLAAEDDRNTTLNIRMTTPAWDAGEEAP